MRFAILSDIHGNLHALDETLRRAEEIGCQRIVCLGDVVGYGPFPNECCEIIQQRAAAVVLGNHDAAASGLLDPYDFTDDARRAVRWCAGVMSADHRSFLRALPLTERMEGVLFVHATPIDPARWHYLFSSDAAALQFVAVDFHVCFIGHTHHPIAWALKPDGTIEEQRSETVRIAENERYIVNVGSVGQPRDGSPDACFGVFDTDAGEFSWERVPYDITATQSAMRQLDLPEFLIRRLEYGR